MAALMPHKKTPDPDPKGQEEAAFDSVEMYVYENAVEGTASDH